MAYGLWPCAGGAVVRIFRYSRWDGSQQVFPFSADDIMEALSDDLLADGDLWNALERIMQWGLDGQDGERMEGLQQLLEQLRERRQQELNRYDMSSVFDEIKERSENYEFMDQQARDKFQELLEMLKRQVMQQAFQGMKDTLQNMDPEQVQRMKDMMRDLNQMLRDRMQGKEPKFQEFMDK